MIPSAVRGIFELPPTSFFWLEIKWDHMLQQGWDFCLHIGWKNGKTAGKIPTWSEKFRHGWKNSDMVGKIFSLAGLYDNRICCTGPPEPVFVNV
jgi:hypothetical protein